MKKWFVVLFGLHKYKMRVHEITKGNGLSYLVITLCLCFSTFNSSTLYSRDTVDEEIVALTWACLSSASSDS